MGRDQIPDPDGWVTVTLTLFPVMEPIPGHEEGMPTNSDEIFSSLVGLAMMQGVRIS